MSSTLVSMVCLCLVANPPAALGGGGQENANAIAQTAVERLFDAVQKRDLDRFMKLVDVPFCFDGREIVKDKDLLRKLVDESFQRPKDKENVALKMHIKDIGTIQSFIDKKKPPLSRKFSLKDVLRDTDQVVYVELERPTGGVEPVWIGVRIEKGQARIVGILD